MSDEAKDVFGIVDFLTEKLEVERRENESMKRDIDLYISRITDLELENCLLREGVLTAAQPAAEQGPDAKAMIRALDFNQDASRPQLTLVTNNPEMEKHGE